MKALDSLARLLATENLQVVRGNYNTASFDCEKRILRIPNWDYLGKDASDLFISHEVGHALWTPVEAIDMFNMDPRLKGCPFSVINILEDVRIERMIQNKYPGLIAVYRRGYKDLMDIDLFKLRGENIGRMSFFNRLNLYAKIGVHASVDIPMSDDDMKIYAKAYATETINDVLDLAAELWKPTKEKKEHAEKDAEEEPDATAPGEGSEGEGEGDQSPSDFTSAGGDVAPDASEEPKEEAEKDGLSTNDENPSGDKADDADKSESASKSDSAGDDSDDDDAEEGEGDSAGKPNGDGDSNESSDKNPQPADSDKADDPLPELSEDDFKSDDGKAEENLAALTEEQRLASNVIVVTSDFSYALNQVVIPYEKCRSQRASTTLGYWGKIA
jgi:hypothetical protein